MDEEVKKSIKRFYSQFPVRRFDKGELIMRPDKDVNEVFYLVEGIIVQYDITASGSEVVVNVFKPGAFFPMSVAINRTPNRYFFEAASPVTMHAAPASQAVAFVKEHPDVLFNLLSRVYSGTDGLLRRMAHLMGGNARSRLIFELVNAAYRFGEPHANHQTIVPLTESDLAKRSGLTRETISRNMRALKDDGLVRIEPAGIIVSDLARLESLLGSEL